jgi:hypothetical protein
MSPTPSRPAPHVLAGLCLAVATTAATMVPSSASAAPGKARDARHDVLSASADDTANPRRPEPRVALGDVTALRVKLGADLVVTTTYRRLGASGYQRYSWSVRTPGASSQGGDWWISFDTDPGRDTGEVWVVDPQGHDRDCGSVELDRTAGTSTLTLTHECLADAAWVRVGMGVAVIRRGRQYLDDAQRVGVGNSWRLGRRVAREPEGASRV